MVDNYEPTVRDERSQLTPGGSKSVPVDDRFSVVRTRYFSSMAGLSPARGLAYTHPPCAHTPSRHVGSNHDPCRSMSRQGGFAGGCESRRSAEILRRNEAA